MSLKFLMQFQAYISNLALILLVEYFLHQKQQCNQPQSMIGYVFVREGMLRQSGVTLVGECGGGVRWGLVRAVRSAVKVHKVSASHSAQVFSIGQIEN